MIDRMGLSFGCPDALSMNPTRISLSCGLGQNEPAFGIIARVLGNNAALTRAEP
jgi:hypothetical protein